MSDGGPVDREGREATRAASRPMFSICMPVWNGTPWLGRAIESVRGQTYPDWELIVGDNASDDDPAAIVAESGDPRIRFARWDDHVPIFENFNRVFRLSQGMWLYLLPADDQLLPDCLERIAAAIAAAPPGIAMVVTGAARVDVSGASVERAYYGIQGKGRLAPGVHDPADWIRAVCARGAKPWDSGAISAGVLWRMDTVYRTDYPTMSADLELSVRAAAFGPVVSIPEELIAITAHDTSQTHGQWRNNLERDEPFTPQGLAIELGFRAHEENRTIQAGERAVVGAAIARTFLRRAGMHRIQPWGHGRRGALRDVSRAVHHSPRTVIPGQLPYLAAVMVLPAGLLRRIRGWRLRHRSPSRASGTGA